MGRSGKTDLRIWITDDAARRIGIAAAARKIDRSQVVQEILDASPALSFRLPDVPEPEPTPRAGLRARRIG